MYVPILMTIYKRTQTPRFLWEWAHMHKQLIPGRFLSSHVA